MQNKGLGDIRRIRRRQRGVVAIEYILVCALLVLAVAASVPFAMNRFGYAYRVITIVLCSPVPSGW